MYAEFFGLSELPFNNTPDPRFFYPTTDHEEALASMIYAVAQRKGFMLLTGEAGTGKTLLTKMVLHHFPTGICGATINHTVRSASDLLAAVCNAFGIPVPGSADTMTHVRVLQDFLLAKHAHGIPIVLMIDEAQTLPPEGFEQLRILGNLEDDSAKLLQTLIVGQPELRPLLQTPGMRQLRQRIFRAFHLGALSREQCQGYIEHRLAVAGAEDVHVFDESAIGLIHRHAQGLPRLINTVCDNAMLSAYAADQKAIDERFVDSVIAQMLTIEQRRILRAPPELGDLATPPPCRPNVGQRRDCLETMPTQYPVDAPGARANAEPRALQTASGLSHEGELDGRLARVETEFDVLTDRIERLERFTAAPTGRMSTRLTERRVASLLKKTHERLTRVRRDTQNQLGEVTRQTDDKLTTAIETTEDRVRRVLRNTEDKLVGVVRHADARVTGMARKTDDLCQRLPDLCASSHRRDHQLRRLASIVQRIVDGAQTDRTPTESPTPHGESTVSQTSTSRPNPVRDPAPAVRPSVAATSERVKELVHQARSSMGDLRALVTGTSSERLPRATLRSAAGTPRSESPVAALADEVRHLSDIAAQR